MPIAFIDSDVIVSGSALVVPNASLYEYGILQSKMSMAWVKTVCGRIKSDFRYSNTIVYNNFPWPLDVDEEIINRCNTSASAIIKARLSHPDSNLASLYDPISMPLDLLKAHESNDKAVDKAYGYKGKDDDASRVAFLFKLYEEQTSLLPTTDTKTKRIKKIDQTAKDFYE